ERFGCVHPARHRRGTIGGTTLVWSRHGAIAALGSRGSDILERAMGSGRPDLVHAPDVVSLGGGATHEGARCPRVAVGQCAAADATTEVLPAGALRRLPRDHRGCARIPEK